MIDWMKGNTPVALRGYLRGYVDGKRVATINKGLRNVATFYGGDEKWETTYRLWLGNHPSSGMTLNSEKEAMDMAELLHKLGEI